MKAADPKVFLIAATELNGFGVADYLTHIGATEFPP